MPETIREMYIRGNPKSAELCPTCQEVFPTDVSHDMRVTDPLEGMDAAALKNILGPLQNGFRQALQVRGVDLMSRCSGVLSRVHTEADIDESLIAFDGAVQALRAAVLVQHG